MNPDFNVQLSRMLAHSAVFFSRQEWLPVCDAIGGDLFSEDESTQATENEQVGAEGGGQGSTTLVSGAETGTGDSAGGSAVLSGGSHIGSNVSGRDNTSNVTINTLDPQVAEDALASNVVTTNSALASNSSIANTALDDLESTATASINAGAASVALNDQFGEAALNAAANAEADSTTALEATGTESETLADNALAAAQNETLAGVTPAQAFQAIQPTTPGTLSSSTLSSLATWVTIIAGGFAIYYYVFKKKAA